VKTSKRSVHALTSCLILALITACSTQTFHAGEPCKTTNFTVVDGFSGARRGTCKVLATDHVRLDIRPESNGRINNSPWYAFKLAPSTPTTATITLRYHNGNHRYLPKISNDGLVWTVLGKDRVTTSHNGRRATVEISLQNDVVWVAAQEIIAPPIYDIWSDMIVNAADVSSLDIGKSGRGLPIRMLESNPDARDVLLLVGRQHPPEVSGAIAFLDFAETIFGASDLAKRFRHRFRVLAIPLLNPDGVVGGNWRHNLGDADLNRDWGPFAQTETRHVAALLDRMDEDGSTLRMFIDFHSTQRNVFYTQLTPTEPRGFTQAWLENSRARIRGYAFQNDRGPGENATVAKNYIYNRYGIPAVTYEVGDETDRVAIRDAAHVFAEELMKLMLSQKY
jgi:hypothetical protein